MAKITVQYIQDLKNRDEKISVLTAYDYSTAKYLDESGIEIILVGDSLANVALGYESTHEIGVDEMQIFVRAVAKGVQNAFVVGDMPFMSVNISQEKAMENITKMIKAGANAVKIEGCSEHILAVVRRCTESGIPVMAHLGFTPQYINAIGGYKVQGKTDDTIEKILEQARLLQDAGAFSIVLEMVPEDKAKYITENLSIPTIGIGAGRYCGGQVLVTDDLLGKFSDYKPKFVRRYADLATVIKDAVTKYKEDVKLGTYPNDSEIF